MTFVQNNCLICFRPAGACICRNGPEITPLPHAITGSTALIIENATLRTQLAECQRSREQLDCRFAGKYWEESGSHCPADNPCMRCELEARADKAEAERDRLRGELKAAALS